MRMIRWTPAAATQLSDVHREMDRLFGNFAVARPAAASCDCVSLPVDIEETTEAYVLTADLPGVAPKAIKITFESDVLKISGERRIPKSATDGAQHLSERASGAFERAFRLTLPVSGDQVKATYRDGVLTVQVPKAEQAKAREIEVQVG